jgi:hypothetical protein
MSWNPQQGLITDVNDTGDNLLLVTPILAIIYRRCTWPCEQLIASFIDNISPNFQRPGGNGLLKKPDVENLVSDSL